jgi:hypothetical protein
MQWNLDFVFLESAFSLIPHVLLLISPEHSQEKYYTSLESKFVLATQLFDYAFNLSTTWPVAVGLSTLFTKGKERVFFSTIFKCWIGHAEPNQCM